jgi:hypothetical protein
MRTQATLAALAATAILAACGGGGHDNPPATSEVPASASASVGGFVDYLKKLVASAADTLEPVDTAAVTGPTDETSEPQKVD